MRTRPFDRNAVAYQIAEWDANITTLAQLAAYPTTNLVVPSILAWILEAEGTAQVWRLIYGTNATADGIQRPDDWNEFTNPKVWFRAST